MGLEIIKIAAFADDEKGGNPAGIVLTDAMPDDQTMQKIAADLGYSETVFAVPAKEGWRARYFTPENEVPFCGHATIALGAALASRFGAGEYPLHLNDGDISVTGGLDGDLSQAQLKSPPTRNNPSSDQLMQSALDLFGFKERDLELDVPSAVIHAGADHLFLPIKSRATLAAMNYDLDAGRELMLEYGLVTIMLVYRQSQDCFDVRNAFASGGVLEDPATGAAAAAFAGYIRDAGLMGFDWSETQLIKLKQGDDMGSPSRLFVTIPPEMHAPILVRGKTRILV